MKSIPLTKELVAWVDDADYEFLSQWKWYASFEYKYYAVRWSKKNEHGDGKRFKIRMHRVLMGLGPRGNEVVDHKDNDGLNNQRGNLETVTSLENMHRVQNWLGGRTWKAKKAVGQ
jgi:HNH endonuclease